MAAESVSSDMSVGLSALFASLGLLGAVGMFLFAMSGDQVSTGASFAVAMFAAAVLVTAIHVYE